MAIHSITLATQAVFYIVTGLWSLVSRPLFERVTGPKIDYWLVRMVGLLAVVIGAALAAGVYRNDLGAPMLILAIGSALSFAFIDLRYALPRRISRIYLLDAPSSSRWFSSSRSPGHNGDRRALGLGERHGFRTLGTRHATLTAIS